MRVYEIKLFIRTTSDACRRWERLTVQEAARLHAACSNLRRVEHVPAGVVAFLGQRDGDKDPRWIAEERMATLILYFNCMPTQAEVGTAIDAVDSGQHGEKVLHWSGEVTPAAVPKQ